MYYCSMYSKELLKGTLSAIILNLLADKKSMYGYQIAQEVKEASDSRILLKEGSLYPALHKLEKEGLVKIREEHIGKRVRRYYSLTPEGEKARISKLQELQSFMQTIGHILALPNVKGV